VSYAVSILRRAQRELAALPQETYQRIKAAISDLTEDTQPQGCKNLTGRAGWRIRVGAYRIIYQVDDAARTVTVSHLPM
jgi:mRNA interferase RelE/StbE